MTLFLGHGDRAQTKRGGLVDPVDSSDAAHFLWLSKQVSLVEG